MTPSDHADATIDKPAQNGAERRPAQKTAVDATRQGDIPLADVEQAVEAGAGCHGS